MKNAFLKGAGLFVLLLVLFMTMGVQLQAQAPARRIPTFQFYHPDQSPFTNSNLANGRPHFFLFFDTSCDHCQHAIQYLNGHYSDFSKAAIYLVCLEGMNSIQPFLARYGASLLGKKNVTLLLDKRNEFIAKFTPRKYPSIFLYGADRNLLLYHDDEQQLPAFATIIQQQAKKKG